MRYCYRQIIGVKILAWYLIEEKSLTIFMVCLFQGIIKRLDSFHLSLRKFLLTDKTFFLDYNKVMPNTIVFKYNQ